MNTKTGANSTRMAKMRTSRPSLFTLAALALSANAATVSIPQPAPTAFADGEATASTDISIEVPGTLSATITFTAIPTNCIELVFGRDSNFDDALDWPEASFKIGWDAGEWIASSPITGETLAEPPSSPNPQKTLSVFVRIDYKGEAASLSILENNVPILADALPLLAAAGRIDLWNCVRETVRGLPNAAAVAVAAHRDGSVFFVK